MTTGSFEIVDGVPEYEPRGKRWKHAVDAAFANPGKHIELNQHFKTRAAARIRREYAYMRGDNGETLYAQDRWVRTSHPLDPEDGAWRVTIWAASAATAVAAAAESEPDQWTYPPLADPRLNPPLFDVTHMTGSGMTKADPTEYTTYNDNEEQA